MPFANFIAILPTKAKNLSYRTGMAKHEFLSAEWITSAKEIQDSYKDKASEAPLEVTMNLTILNTPFQEGEIKAFLDSRDGKLVIDLGQLDTPDVFVTLDYDTCKAVLIDGNGDAALQAFMTGKIMVEGDVGKLLAYQSTPPGQVQLEITEKLREITK
ncbi:MAG: SCP2 sterol-binding domain-containing protein [Firmicutes bacterium]|nr:SCP2 sterol-binding domain-containing protein [Bacillota bacterium]